jgi:cell division protein FtsN
MKKFAYVALSLCAILAMSSCKSSESAYRKAYEKVQLQGNANNQATAPVAVQTTTTPVAKESNDAVRQEKVSVVSGDEIKGYSVVCGSFSLKANAEGLKTYLDNKGYKTTIAFNAEKAMYRVVLASFDDRAAAAQARDAFKAKYPDRKDFQGSWLLYRIY